MSPTIAVVLQYVFAVMAVATLVTSDVLSWGLSQAVVALLGGIAGLALKRPSDMLAKP